MSDYCRRCREAFNESHYHCGNCGKVSSMYGHYDWETRAFDCEKPKRKPKPTQSIHPKQEVAAA